MEITIYHNPRCSKSRATLALIEERGFTPTVIEYLEHPPSKRELKSFLEKLGTTPAEFIRKKEAAYTDAGLSSSSSDDELLNAMVRHPKLIERPIVVAGDRVALGRPPENALALLDQ